MFFDQPFFLLALMSRKIYLITVPENLIPCERSSSKHLKISNSTRSGIVCESPREEFHKSQNGAEQEVLIEHYCLFKNLYLEQCCWQLENVGPHSKHFDLVVTCRLHCATDHTVEAAGPQATQYVCLKQSTKN